MLTDQELGELVAKVQADDVRPKDLRSFLLAVMHDEEMRNNLKLAGKVSHLERDIREKNCAANFSFLLAHSTLSPEAPPKKRNFPHATTRSFAERFNIATITEWKTHVNAVLATTASKPESKKNPKPNLHLSDELYALLRSLEDFWDVRGLYLDA